MTTPAVAAPAGLVAEVTNLLLQVANLPHQSPDKLDPEMSLFATGLGLDSIDVLELVVTIDKRYGLKIKNDEAGRQVLRSVRSIADAIHQKNTQQPG